MAEPRTEPASAPTGARERPTGVDPVPVIVILGSFGFFLWVVFHYVL